MVDFNLMRQNQHPSKLKRNSLVYGVLISSLSFTYPMITVHFFFFFYDGHISNGHGHDLHC